MTPRRLTTSDPEGFFLLGAAEAPAGALPAHALVLESPEELCWLRHRLALPDTPEVDFQRHVVLVLVQDAGDCPGPAEPRELLLGNDGVLRPNWVHPYRVCAGPAIQRAERAVLLAVARHGLPGEGFGVKGADGGTAFFALRHPLGRLAAVAEPPELLARPVTGPPRGQVPLPPSGEAALARLHDGSFVWVVHHVGGDVSVLEPAVGAGYDCVGFPGLRRLARWEPLTRRFEGRWDEYGVSSTEPNLHRYQAEIDVGARAVRIGHPAPPLARRRMSPIGDGQSDGTRMFHAIRSFPWLPLDTMSSVPEGKTVLLDASLVVDDQGVARACPGAEASEAVCPSDAPVIAGVRAASARKGERIRGPLVARVGGGAISDVLLTRD